MPFPIPSFSKEIGENAQTLQIVLPNLGSDREGYLPIRDWIRLGQLAGAFVTFYLFTDLGRAEHNYRVAEQAFEDGSGQAWVKINLRQPDDRDALVMTRTYTNADLGISARYALA